MISKVLSKNKDINTLASNTIMLYIMQISGYIFPLFTFPYLARTLSPEYYGMMTFVTSTMVYFQMLIDFGFILSATKECSIHREDKNKLSEIFSSVVISKSILSIIGFIILSIMVLFIPSFSDKKIFTILYYLTVVTTILMPDYLFRGLEKMKTIMTITIIGKFIYTVSVFIFIKGESDYLLIPLLVVASNILVFYFTYKEIKKEGVSFIRCSMNTIFDTIKQSAVFFVSKIASTVYSASNVFVLGLVISNTSLAVYGVANTIINMIKSLFTPIADSIYPYIIRAKNFKIVKIILLISTPVILIGTILLYVLAEPIILILGGPEYTAAIPILRMMLPLVLLTLPSYLLGYPVLGAMGRMKEANLSVVFAAIFHTSVLIILFISSNLTITNVVLATIISELLVLGIRVYFITKYRNDYKSKKINE